MSGNLGKASHSSFPELQYLPAPHDLCNFPSAQRPLAATFCQVPWSLALHTHGLKSSQRLKRTPHRFLEVLFYFLLSSTTPSEVQSSTRTRLRSAPVSDTLELCVDWKVPPSKKLRWVGGSPHTFPYPQKSIPVVVNHWRILFLSFYIFNDKRINLLPVMPSWPEQEVGIIWSFENQFKILPNSILLVKLSSCILYCT